MRRSGGLWVAVCSQKTPQADSSSGCSRDGPGRARRQRVTLAPAAPRGAAAGPRHLHLALLGKERLLSAREGLHLSALPANEHLNPRAGGLATCASPEGSCGRGEAVWYVTVGLAPVWRPPNTLKPCPRNNTPPTAVPSPLAFSECTH